MSGWAHDEKQSLESGGETKSARRTLPVTLSQVRLTASGQERRAKKHCRKTHDNIDQGDK